MALLSMGGIGRAAELFPNAPKEWQNQTSSGMADVKHFKNVAPGSQIEVVYPESANIASGYALWEVAAVGKQRVQNSTGTATGNLGTITHMVPTSAFWRDYFGDYYKDYMGYTRLYAPNGNEITMDNADSMGSYIRSATIYYMPYDNEYVYLQQLMAYSPSEFTSLIAHEIGHALGFGHVTDTSSIMYNRAEATALNANDKANLAAKYPVS